MIPVRVRDKQMYLVGGLLRHTETDLTQPRTRVENNPIFTVSEF